MRFGPKKRTFLTDHIGGLPLIKKHFNVGKTIINHPSIQEFQDPIYGGTLVALFRPYFGDISPEI